MTSTSCTELKVPTNQSIGKRRRGSDRCWLATLLMPDPEISPNKQLRKLINRVRHRAEAPQRGIAAPQTELGMSQSDGLCGAEGRGSYWRTARTNDTCASAGPQKSRLQWGAKGSATGTEPVSGMMRRQQLPNIPAPKRRQVRGDPVARVRDADHERDASQLNLDRRRDIPRRAS